MKLKLKSITQSILFRVILLFAAIMLPVYALGLGIYTQGYRMVSREITGSAFSQVEFYLKTLENEIERIYTLQYECVNDDDLIYLVNAQSILDYFERSQYMLRVQSRLRVMKNSSEYISSIQVHVPVLGKTISSENGVVELDPSWPETAQRADGGGRAGINYLPSGIVLDVQYPNLLRADGSSQPLFVMELAVSNARIRSRVLGFGQYPDSRILLQNEAGDFELCANLSGPALEDARASALAATGREAVHVKLEGKPYEMVSQRSESTGLRLTAFIPTGDVYAEIAGYRLFFIVFSVISLLVLVLFMISMRVMIHKPVTGLVSAFETLSDGDFSVRVNRSQSDEFQYLYNYFNAMAQNLQRLIGEVYQQKILAQRAELKQLQSQINPHFLYNSFFNIYRMAKDEDCESIAEFSHYLGEYYQFLTRSAEDEVPLEKELQHAQTYLNIQKMRFHNRLTVEAEPLPPAFRYLMVPRLIVQPLIENSLEHGLKNMADARLRVAFRAEGERLYILIEDNGDQLTEQGLTQLAQNLAQDDPAMETTGTINIHRRIRLKFGPGCGLTVSRSPLGGLAVAICLEQGGS